MERKIVRYLLLVIFIFCFIGTNAQTKDLQKPSKEAVAWFNNQEWLNGLEMKQGAPIDTNEFYTQYQANKIYWDKAFAFLKNADLKKLPVGKYPIDGEWVFAVVTKDLTKDLDQTKWESHRRYNDLQYIISGKEQIEVCDISKAKLTNPYSAENDVANYNAEGEIYLAKPGTFFIFFNNDVHRASISTGRNKADKKIVIKIRTAE